MSEPLAIVLAGGGARCAYQAGVLKALSRHFPELEVPIFTGVSAGAINSAFLANHPGTFEAAALALCELWGRLDTEQVLKVQAGRLLARVFGWAFRLASGGLGRAPEIRGMVDTSPLRSLLVRELCQSTSESNLSGVQRKLDTGRLRALALTTTSYATGQTITWVQGQDLGWKRGVVQSRQCQLSVDHVMASAAIPLFFPAIRLNEGWHGDGGIRQTSPLSPALHLGARRILAISPRRRREDVLAIEAHTQPYPPPAQILGILMNAVFLDNIDHDADAMDRLNTLLRELPEERRHSLVPVDLLVIRPSADLGSIAGEYEKKLPFTFRYLTRGWGTKRSRASDSLAMLLFEAEYTRRLMEIGERDGEARLDDVRRLFEGSR